MTVAGGSPHPWRVMLFRTASLRLAYDHDASRRLAVHKHEKTRHWRGAPPAMTCFQRVLGRQSDGVQSVEEAIAIACRAQRWSCGHLGRPPLCRVRPVDAGRRPQARPRGDGGGSRPRWAGLSGLLRRGHAAAGGQDAGLSRPGRGDADLPRLRPLPLRQGEAAVQRCRRALRRRDGPAAARSVGRQPLRADRRQGGLRRGRLLLHQAGADFTARLRQA